MRRLITFIFLFAAIAGGAYWYVFVSLPGSIKETVDARLDELRPDIIASYQTIEIDVFDEKAVLTGFLVRTTDSDSTLTVETLTVSPAEGGEDRFNALANKVRLAPKDGSPLTAALVKVDNAFVRPGDADNAIAKLKQLGFGVLEIRTIATEDKKFRLARVRMDGLSDAAFEKAVASDISMADGEFDLKIDRVTANRLDVSKIASLPRTFRGFTDWSKLDTGASSLSGIEFKLPEGKFRLRDLTLDGIRKGRIEKLHLSEMGLTGETEKKEMVDITIEKIELLDFPIITDFPTRLEDVQSFQMRHKNILYGGMDFKGFRVALDDLSFEIGRMSVPPIEYGKTESGIQYAKKGKVNLEMSMATGIFRKSGKEIPPFVEKLIDRPKLEMNMTSTTVMDHFHKFVAVRKTAITIPDFLTLKLSGRVNDVPLRYFETPGDPLVQQIALKQMTFGDLDVTLVNEGLAELLLEGLAADQGVTPNQFKRALVQQLQQFARQDGTPEGLQIARQLYAFLVEPNSLKLSLRPRQKIRVLALGEPGVLNSLGNVSRVLGLRLQANAEKK